MRAMRRSSCPTLQQQRVAAAEFMENWIDLSSSQYKQIGASIKYNDEGITTSSRTPPVSSFSDPNCKLKRRVSFCGFGASSVGVNDEGYLNESKQMEPPSFSDPNCKLKRRVSFCGFGASSVGLNDEGYLNESKQMEPPTPGPAMRQSRLEPVHRRSYFLGDVGEPQDIKKPSERRAAALKVHDYAFVRRSDGKWTYAILANKPSEDEARFVLDEKGSTKTFSRDHWSKLVRCVQNVSSPGLSSKEKNHQSLPNIATTDGSKPTSYPRPRRTRRKSSCGDGIQHRRKSISK